MAKFSVPDPNDDDAPVKPAADEVRAMNGLPPPPPPATVNPNALPASSTAPQNPTSIPVMAVGDPSMGSANRFSPPPQMNTQAPGLQQTQVGLAQAAIDDKIIDQQIKKEDEHWMKAYWRPAMGWLYMLMCFMDFVLFPIISMMMPIIMKAWGIQVNYTAWQSLTLSNGGLIHLAFGAILGVSAWTRGQEKLAKIN